MGMEGNKRVWKGIEWKERKELVGNFRNGRNGREWKEMEENGREWKGIEGKGMEVNERGWTE